MRVVNGALQLTITETAFDKHPTTVHTFLQIASGADGEAEILVTY